MLFFLLHNARIKNMAPVHLYGGAGESLHAAALKLLARAVLARRHRHHPHTLHATQKLLQPCRLAGDSRAGVAVQFPRTP